MAGWMYFPDGAGLCASIFLIQSLQNRELPWSKDRKRIWKSLYSFLDQHPESSAIRNVLIDQAASFRRVVHSGGRLRAPSGAWKSQPVISSCGPHHALDLVFPALAPLVVARESSYLRDGTNHCSAVQAGRTCHTCDVLNIYIKSAYITRITNFQSSGRDYTSRTPKITQRRRGSRVGLRWNGFIR